MSSNGSLSAKLSQKTALGLKLWVLIGLCVGLFIVVILCILSVWVTFRRKSRRRLDRFSHSQIPNVTKDIRVDRIGAPVPRDRHDSLSLHVHDKSSDRNSGKMFAHLGRSKSSDVDTMSQCSSMHPHDRAYSSQSGEDGSFGTIPKNASLSYGVVTASPLIGLPEISHLGWGHWFTLRDLQMSTNHFSPNNIIGEGGYGVVYKGLLVNGTEVAVKRLVNNLGQAEKEFSVEVEAIGHVRHKNLVRLLGYCIEGVHRMLVYEYVNNGNLEEWLHGAMRQQGTLTWEARIKVLLGTAKALAYLHESIEPKVVHRDIKASNILIDTDFNAKVSDFGLAKLLDSGESHITTRVMGTFGYVAPEYANSGLLNEKSDIYSFGVLLLEAITGRDPVDYSRPANEVNLVEWLKVMVGTRRSEEVVDPNLEVKPTTRGLKRALLVALRCIDPDPEKRPKMSQVVRMLEADDVPNREDRRNRKSRTTSMEFEIAKETCSSVGDEISIVKVEDTNSHAPSTTEG
ncbi:probable receptor-like protein kinase At2g42960 [Beta vulgaris subsp. vulgaris]|uniref:probable receptor-like protein kinase At2g42960 n=1 Tax=Beta vulgaris subsp. vulgaris TaxID=3555 RepID=UPI00053FE860|nr:probable receptor-like protein kinase At2g42960 [Beta vulgaris subsp. vulgaris]XP_010688889.1 probable receptor-like protein kinase At2g42960 [Beta vulgaris subsp. vulgaris]